MSSNTSLCALYGWSRIVEGACFKTLRNWGPNITLLSSMSSEGMGASHAVQGSTTREVFEAYVDKVLAPALKRGQIVRMDNLPSHKGEPRRGMIEERGCELLYLPPYSPNLSPIEEAFSKIKRFLRQISAQTREALVSHG